MAELNGLEPSSAWLTTKCLTSRPQFRAGWVGRRELNPQLPQSQCGALPLSYNPHKLAGMTRLELANQLIENQSAFHFAFIPIGTRGGIRTHTVQSLNLSSPASWTTRVNLVLPEGFEPSTTRLSTVRVYQLRHDSTIGYGGRIRTYVNEFQRLAPFRLGHSVIWWTWHDLNVRPRPSQSRALIPLSYRSTEFGGRDRSRTCKRLRAIVFKTTALPVRLPFRNMRR